jgi:hypothetical protein
MNPSPTKYLLLWHWCSHRYSSICCPGPLHLRPALRHLQPQRRLPCLQHLLLMLLLHDRLAVPRTSWATISTSISSSIGSSKRTSSARPPPRCIDHPSTLLPRDHEEFLLSEKSPATKFAAELSC